MNTLSVVVLTYNNEDIIARFARSVAWADELIVVDSGSTDNTLAVARAEHPNCRVLVRPLESFADQRNHGLDHARGDWVMHCDSDYVVPPGLRDEIREVLRQDAPPYQAYNVFLNLYWKNRLVAHASGPSGFQCMLHRRECARFAGRIHEKLETDVPVGMLREPLDHITGESLDERLRKMIRYANKEVDAVVAGERPFATGRLRMFWHPLRRLARDVVIRRAYRDGMPGMAWALMTAFRRFLIHFRYWQIHDTTWRDYEPPATGPTRSSSRPATQPARGGRRRKLLVIAHHVVVKEYQELWTSAARQYPELSIEIVCPEVYGQMGAVRAESLDEDLVPVHRLKTVFGRSGRQHLHFYRGLGKTLDAVRPDCIYCAEESNSLVTAQVARACRKRGVPVLFWTSLNQPRIYRRMYGRLNIRRYLFHHCQRYVFAHCVGANATSESAREVLRKQGYEGRIVCRPTHGIGDDFLRIGRERVAGQGAPSSPMEVGFVGRLTNFKAVDVLIRAFARMRHRDRIRLTIRGEGEREAEWRAVAKVEGVADELEWLPMVPYDRMPEVMKGLDVFVLPSMLRDGVDEKFGRVAIEALAAGAVVVGSRDGGIPLAMAGGGILFSPGDADELARVLDRLATDPSYWKSRQRTGYETVKQTYSYDVVSRNLIEGIREEVGWFTDGETARPVRPRRAAVRAA